jgi:hypothetical protein
METRTKSLYEKDYAEWFTRTAEALRSGRLEEVDLERVAEEIDDLGKSARKAVKSQLRRMLLHLIKQEIQPHRNCASWQVSIAEATQEIRDDLEDSPSLITYLEEQLDTVYQQATELALIEVGNDVDVTPLATCPIRLNLLLEGMTHPLVFFSPAKAPHELPVESLPKPPRKRWWPKA